MKKILMITTGGTVCSTDEGGLTPTMGPDAALKYIPSVYKLCNVDFLPALQHRQHQYGATSLAGNGKGDKG